MAEKYTKTWCCVCGKETIHTYKIRHGHNQQEMKKAQKELLEEYFKFERKDRNSFMISELNKLSNN